MRVNKSARFSKSTDHKTKKMKEIVCFLLLINFNFCFSQIEKVKNYDLTIKKGKIVKENNQIYWLIPVTFENNTLETLRYFSMSCSWQEFYFVYNKAVQIDYQLCDKNIPIILTLEPNQKSRFEIKLLKKRGVNNSKISFKIGFNLIKVKPEQRLLDFDINEKLKHKSIIWSNLISMQ